MNKKICDHCQKEVKNLFDGSNLEEKICQKCLEKIKYIEDENDCHV